MPTSSFTFYQDFKEQLGKGVHNFSSATLKIALSNTAPDASDVALADAAQISTGGGYTGGAGGGVALDSVTYSETAGVGTLACADETITASGGSIGPFRYAILYNDSAASPADALIGYWDYGSSITLADGESLLLNFGSSIITIT